MENLSDELEWLKASYNANEIEYFVSNKSPILKFTLHPKTWITFEIPDSYPQVPAHISMVSSYFTNLQKQEIEHKIRDLASQLTGTPMVMELVNKTQELLKSHTLKMITAEESLPGQDNYMALILIDHMRQKSKYTKTLLTWANELNIYGAILFYRKNIFLILEGMKQSVKEFIVRHKTVPIDVDSTGKPCKEKMSKILFESERPKHFTSFVTEEFSSLEDIELYFSRRNLKELYKILNIN